MPTSSSHSKLFLFAVPALVLILLAFVLPIALALMESVRNGELSTALPTLKRDMRSWDEDGLPPAAVQDAFASALVRANADHTLGMAERRMNLEIPGFSSLLRKTAGQLGLPTETANLGSRLSAIDGRWAEPKYWLAIKRATYSFTDLYFLTAVDLRHDDTGRIVAQTDDKSIYIDVMLRTLSIASMVTIMALILAYPMSYLFASLNQGLANALLLLVLLTFWTSVLVRTAAWLVLLQREGLINKALLALGLIGAPLPLIFNRFGTVIALTQILLPYMVLTLYGVMKGIDPRYLKAANSLGAPSWTAFRKVYLPLTFPGIGAGGLLVFILAVGSYVTPALLGGQQDQMIPYFIASNINQTINWGQAAALSVLLVLVVFVLYALYGRIAGAFRVGAG